MAATGEKYTLARRRVEEDAAVRDIVGRSADDAVGLADVRIERIDGVLCVYVRAARPILLVGPRGDEADRLRGEMESLTGVRVKLEIREMPAPQQDT